MPESVERLGSSLLNLVLGGVILWVGQTTFRHSGILATVDEKFLAVNQQFTDVDKRQESMRKWLESVVTDMKDSNRTQFTAKDGDKLVGQVRQVETSTTDLERRLVERIGGLEARLAALETRQNGSHEVAALQWEVAQLRNTLGRTAMAQESISQQSTYQPSERVARGTPVFLPPVGDRR
jgi:hypothetical protein